MFNPTHHTIYDSNDDQQLFIHNDFNTIFYQFPEPVQNITFSGLKDIYDVGNMLYFRADSTPYPDYRWINNATGKILSWLLNEYITTKISLKSFLWKQMVLFKNPRFFSTWTYEWLTYPSQKTFALPENLVKSVFQFFLAGWQSFLSQIQSEAIAFWFCVYRNCSPSPLTAQKNKKQTFILYFSPLTQA